MIKEAIGTGASIEEAKEAALTELNAGENEDIQFEIISMPKKKTLGLFGGTLAQVRAFIELPDPKPAKKAHEDRKPAPEKKQGKKPEKSEKPEAKKTVIPEVIPEGVPEEALDPASPAAKAIAYLKSVLPGLGCEGLTYTAAELDGGALITISGDDTGVIIGRRGETLDALQYLASLASSKKGGSYYRVTLDIGNYRERREKTLENVARKTASQVLRTGRNRSLEPMNPYERRIIHTTVQGIEGVTSFSTGSGPARHVIISPEGGERRPQRNAAPVSSKADKTVDSASTPLYGRIN